MSVKKTLVDYCLMRELAKTSERQFYANVSVFLTWAGGDDFPIEEFTGAKISEFLVAKQTAGCSAHYRRSLRNHLKALHRFSRDYENCDKIRPVRNQLQQIFLGLGRAWLTRSFRNSERVFSGQGLAGRGQARHGTAWQGMAGRGMVASAREKLRADDFCSAWRGVAGGAWQGKARLGASWRGKARQGLVAGSDFFTASFFCA